MQHRGTHALLVAAALAALLTGCAANPGGAAADTSTAATARSASAKAATPTPKPVDPKVAAQQAAGLTLASYDQLSIKTAAAVHQALATNESMDDFRAVVKQLGAEAGKPVVIVDKYTCNGTGLTASGITGALAEHPVTCGSEWSASESAAVARVTEIAKSDIAVEDGYVLVIVQ